MNKQKIIIYGSGDLAIQLFFYLKSIYNIVGFIDDFKTLGEKIIEDLKILGGINDVSSLYNSGVFHSVCLGIGYNHLEEKSRIYDELLELKIAVMGFIHPSCYVNEYSDIHPSVILYPKSIIDQRVRIEKNVILNLNTLISHDTHIGKNTFIAPGVIISGHCRIGSNCFIGSGTMIKDNITICDNVIIGTGSVVIKDILNEGIYFGNPARLK
jgi:sugar O-acyltransferase (sialic acid O-acetyltransferase NeuD family)